MGCVSSKKENAPGKGMENHERHSQAQTAHYVKDPTTGNPTASKLVSSRRLTLANDTMKMPVLCNVCVMSSDTQLEPAVL